MAKYKTPYANYKETQKKRIKAVLAMEKPDRTLMFPDGLTPPEIAQQLIGVNNGRTPSEGLINLVDEICTELETAKEIDKITE